MPATFISANSIFKMCIVSITRLLFLYAGAIKKPGCMSRAFTNNTLLCYVLYSPGEYFLSVNKLPSLIFSGALLPFTGMHSTACNSHSGDC